MSKNIQNSKLKKANIPLGAASGPQRGDLDSLGFFEAAILYIFGHIPTNAYAILAALFQQEFKHPKFKHPNGIPDRWRLLLNNRHLGIQRSTQ